MDEKKQIVKSTDWLTKGYSEEEIARIKAEAVKEAEKEIRNKQIEEMAKLIAVQRMYGCNEKDTCDMSCQVYKCGCIPYEDATILYNAGYRKQEWISVDEMLPEECKNVLCFARNKTMIAFMEKTEDCGKYVPVFWDWVAYDRDDTYDEVCATNWMPLPEAPKMKGGVEE